MRDMMDYKLQLKRNNNLFMNKEDALNALQNQFNSAGVKDGELIIARYKNNDNIKTIFGISSDKEATGTKYTIFDSEAIPSDVQKKFTDLIGIDPDSNYDTIEKIADALVIINGDASTNGSIEKALADAKADSTSKIEALDVIDTKVAKKFVTQVSETDGKIAVERGEITSTDKTVVINDGADGGIDLSVNVDGTTILKDNSTGKISVSSAALTQYTGKDAVAVGAEVEGEKEISLNIDTSDKILSQSGNGLLTNIKLTWDKAEGLKLIGKNDTVITTIPAADFIKDGMLENVELKQATGSAPIGEATEGTFLVFTFNTDGGNKVINLNVTDLIDIYTGGNGILVNGKEISIKVTDGDKYLEVTSNGIASKGIDTAITTAINTLNVTEQSENGKYVSAISQTNGKINPTLKQVEANEVKLEQIGEVDANGIKLNATTVQEGIAELFTKILDNEEVDAEAINKIKTILGITGEELKYETKSDDTIIGAATSYSDADVKLAEAIRTAQSNAITIQAGDGVNITSNGSEKTINVKAGNDDKLITVDNSGIHTKDNATFDCGRY